MSENLSAKRYEPLRIDLNNKNDSRSLIIELIGKNKHVLEIGTSTGYVTKILKERDNLVTGIEIDKDAAEIARQYCKSMIIGDVEELDFDAYIEPASMDVILLADVLEHLRWPGRILDKAKKYLKPNGYLVVSLPNVSHGDLILNLLNGDFRYTSQGLLDEMHLRFFGRRNIVDIFNRCGYEIKDVHTITIPVGATELRLDLDRIPQELLKIIRALPDFDVYQFVFKAVPSAIPSNESIPAVDFNKIFSLSKEDILNEHKAKEIALSIDCKSSQDKRADLAKKYIRGVGIELGTLHQPLDVPKNVSVYYVDRLSDQKLREHYPEVPESEIIRPDIVDDVQELKSIDDETFDFCIANHVLESMSDPLGAIINWLRVLKPGGILYLSIISGVTNPSDLRREPTTLDHLIEDHSQSNRKDCIHHHTFSEKSIRNLLSHLSSIKRDFFKIIDFIEDESNGLKEYTLILEKDSFLDKIFEILEETKGNDIKNTHIDIIIPVFNAYSEFIKCLYSTLKYSNDCNIIIVNDKSTDIRINELFSKLSEVRLNRLIVRENNRNLGFVKTVNIGMKLHDRDVILLNSDTIVTPRWVDRLQKCAYSDEKIGTVTPFTNNGTICSVPNFCTNNQIPEGFTIDSFSEFLEKISFRRFPELPTAVGFCMYIKRELIKNIGYFDEEAFGKGYGEENDFSLRAIRKGYKNVLCDDVFIFHKEGSSFSSEKDELCKKHLNILANMYPDYLAEVAKFCQQNPLRELHDNIKIRMPSWNPKKKPRILFILHNLGGGTEKHVMDIIESLNKDCKFYILQVKYDQIILSEYNNGDLLKYNFLMPRQLDRFEVHNENYKKRITKIINTFQINIVHVHHLMGHTLDIFDVAYNNRIPIIFSIHDYYAICPRINLLNEKNEYCQDSDNSNHCSFCLSETMGLPLDFVKVWRDEFNEIINKSDIIIVPNISVLDILNKYYIIRKSKSLIVEHGHKKELIKKDIPTAPEMETDFKDKKFNIAYIGVLVLHKGSEIFYKLASSEKLKNRVKGIIIGSSDLYNNPGYYPEINVYVHGRYNDFNELKNIIQRDNVNLVVLPAIWPETFSYTLSEAWACEVPVLVSNIGALKERVERTGGGWTADVSDVRSFETKILEIMGSKEDYQRKKDAVKDIKLMSLNRMITEYKELYKKYISQSYSMYDPQFVLSNLELFQSFDQNFSAENDPLCIIKRLDSTIGQLRTDICERDNRISDLTDQLDQISRRAKSYEHELVEIKKSAIYNLILKFHNSLIEPILPLGTERREVYDLCIKGNRILANEGYKSLCNKYKDWRSYRNYLDKKSYKRKR